MADFDWTDFLAFAEQIVRDPQATESAWRTAINRAYGCAYHEALITAAQLDSHINPHYTNHDDLVAWYLNARDVASAQTIGQTLQTLRKQCTDADYRRDRAVQNQHARFAIAMTRRLLTALHKLPGEWPLEAR